MAVTLAVLIGALGALTIFAASLLVLYRLVLRPRLAAELVRLSGPSVVHALPPQQVMTTFLSKIYGEGAANQAFVAGMLGGEGLEPHGGDLTISTHTTVTLELRAVDYETHEFVLTVGYSFKENAQDYRFVIFATCDPLLRDSIALACSLPLYEAWFVPDQSLFDTSVSEMLTSVNIGMRYTDRRGKRYEVDPNKVELTEVAYRDWPDFLRFFREPLGMMPRQDPKDYMRTLRIFECDLGELTHVDHTVGSIESLSLRSKILGRVNDRFCYWQPPYPCYVESIHFKVADFAVDDDGSWLFRVLPFTFRSGIVTSGWTPAEQLDDLCVRSWLLPGHGVALLWKPAGTASRQTRAT
jgi:hypothetical protein